MFIKAFLASTCAAGAAALLIGASAASAHTIVGNRVFPATLTIDDPGVNDELALPNFGYLAASNYDGTPGPISYTLGWEYSKTITADFAISVGSEGYTWQRNPIAGGWANIETQLKYVFYQSPEQELIVAAAVAFEWGSTGSDQNSSLPADPYTTVTPKLFVGKGFGDVPVEWLRPVAFTGELDYALPTHPLVAMLAPDPDTGVNTFSVSQTPRVLTYGFTLQYSLLYANSFVFEVPDLFKRLIPAVEGIFTTPVSNIGPSVPGEWTHTTTGVVGPSLYYMGRSFEIGVMAQIPINRASGRHPGVLAKLDFFLDDIFPDSIGKPLFGPSQSRRSELLSGMTIH
jgi:hypothetical protein